MGNGQTQATVYTNYDPMERGPFKVIVVGSEKGFVRVKPVLGPRELGAEQQIQKKYFDQNYRR